MEYEILIEYMYDIWHEIDLYDDYVSQYMIEKSEEMYQKLQKYPLEINEYICEKLLKHINKSKPYTTIWVYSFVIGVLKKESVLIELLEYLLENTPFKANTYYFLYYQIKGIIFLTPEFETLEIQNLKWKLLEKTFHLFEAELGMDLETLSIEQRDPNMALVICEQVLVVQHGPTKTALDRCYTLLHRMKKKVLLINSSEILSTIGEIPFWNKLTANYHEELQKNEFLEWKECKIPYFQCDQRMPELNVLRSLLTTIHELKPSIVISIGGSSILAGFVNKIVPTLTIGLTTSGIETSLSDYQIVPFNRSNLDFELLKQMNKDSSYSIEGRFTFSLKPQDEFLTRGDLGLSEQEFVIAIVGARLDSELTSEFLQMLQNLQDLPVKIIIMGRLDRAESLQKQYAWFNKSVLYMGACKDVLSKLELCDIYVNPHRKGGGTSCVEAMHKGLPVVTIDYGDVAGIVGKEFSCSDYAEMETIIRRYYEDKSFYNQQSARAYSIAQEYLDTEREFERCVNIYLERMKEAANEKS